jgi:hypothetical protein
MVYALWEYREGSEDISGEEDGGGLGETELEFRSEGWMMRISLNFSISTATPGVAKEGNMEDVGEVAA